MAISEVKRNTTLPARPVGQAIWRGFMCRCPACGEGRMFGKFLKVNDACPACGTELRHHRADDFPPYLVIFVVGHVVIGLMLHIEMAYTVPASVYLWTMIPLTLVMALGLLQPTKGAVVGLQWAQYMHGFSPDHRPEHDA